MLFDAMLCSAVLRMLRPTTVIGRKKTQPETKYQTQKDV